MTRSAQPANRGSWVTSRPAAPWSIRSRRMPITSSPVAVSSAPVGSSASRSRRGPMRARAMATRWAWPPEISSGNRSNMSSSPTSARAALMSSLSLVTFAPSSSSGRATFSPTVRVGTRLKRWKTTPICWRRSAAARLSLSVAAETPSMRTSPAVGRCSNPATLSRVDLPEPEGPMMATSSPGCTCMLTWSRAVTV